VYYNKGLELLSFGKADQAYMMFNKSINTNLFFAPAHYQIALINYSKGNVDAAIIGLRDIIEKMNPDPQTFSVAKELATKIHENYIVEAANYNNRNRFELAVNSIDKAKEICQTISGIYCSQNLEKEYSRAVQGKYNEHISQINQSISTSNYQKADEQIQTAKIFFQTNAQFLDVSKLDNFLKKQVKYAIQIKTLFVTANLKKEF
jgi:tetratricopeptide (TPR) repeat protein